MFAVTIIAANYAHFARALAKSFLAHNPGSSFYALLIDVDDSAYEGLGDEPFSVLTPGDLNLDREEFLRMALMYDVTELATALKPWALEALLDRGAEVAVYLDPDIFVYAPLSNVEAAAKKNDIVLTPHGTRPMERDGKRPAEADIMQSGIYNLGFIAISDKSREFLTWWQGRLLRDSISAPELMLFTDQRWIDLVPGYWNVAILRDSTLNVAYWNVDKRALSKKGDGVLVDGKPLQFYHFSGFDARKPWLLSKHAGDDPRVLLSSNPILSELCAEYAAELTSTGVAKSDVAYAFGQLSTGHNVSMNLRRLYRQRIVQEDESGVRILPTPFSGHDKEILDILAAPLPEQPLLNEFMLGAWNRRSDLRSAFPDPLGADAWGLNHWARTAGLDEDILEDWQLIKPAKALPKRRTLKERTTRGVNVHGYLTAELGMGELARLVVQATEAGGIPLSPIVNTRHLSRNEASFAAKESTDVYPVDVVVINADQIANWARETQDLGLSPRARAGVWAWEVEEFPAAFDHAFDYVDEVWAISKFSQEAIQRRTSKPVFTIPLPQQIRNRDDVKPVDLPAMGIHDTPYFLVMFDYLSVLDRKNPFAAIDAFAEAFDENDNVQLIIKSINGSLKPLDRERFLYAVNKHKNVHVIEEYLTADQVRELMCGALAYVSLHRSEGYGLTCSEAMSLKVPVIATNYSGNIDFMDESNSLLVPFTLVGVDPSVRVYPASTVWADPDSSVAASYMRRIYDDPAFAAEIGEAGYRSIREADTLGQAATFVSSRVDVLMRRTEEIRAASRRSGGVLRRAARRLPAPVKAQLKKLRSRL